MVFPEAGGVPASNLWRMTAIFEAYASRAKLAPLVRVIGWSRNLAIMERCKDPLERVPIDRSLSRSACSGIVHSIGTHRAT